jgi:hypothetical protein
MPECITQHTTADFSRMPAPIDTLAGGVGGFADAETNARLACAVLELVTTISEAPTVAAAGITLVNRLKTFLRADGVALGMVRGRRRRCRLVAAAGATDLKPGSELTVAVEQALNEAALSDETERAPRSGGRDLQAMLPGAAVECCVLVAEAAPVTGALVVWGRAPEFDRRHVRKVLGFASEPLTAALRLIEQAQQGLLQRALSRAIGSRRWIVWTAIAAMVLVILLQLPYRLSCNCTVEPLKRRFIAAPFAGTFEKSLVRPGDLVAENDLLGRMDGKELRLELAAVMADQEQARKSHDVNLAAGKVAAAQIDKLELQRLQQQQRLLEHRIAHIEIKSPVAGYVISGDMERSEGAPLEIGAVLYEIAPLDQMIVEVAIDDDEIANVTSCQEVAIRFDAYPGEAFQGRLARIHPRSEIRDAQNVFIGEVALENTGVTLRPGMKGVARIAPTDESLLGGVARRLWHAITAAVGV